MLDTQYIYAKYLIIEMSPRGALDPSQGNNQNRRKLSPWFDCELDYGEVPTVFYMCSMIRQQPGVTLSWLGTFYEQDGRIVGWQEEVIQTSLRVKDFWSNKIPCFRPPRPHLIRQKEVQFSGGELLFYPQGQTSRP